MPRTGARSSHGALCRRSLALANRVWAPGPASPEVNPLNPKPFPPNPGQERAANVPGVRNSFSAFGDATGSVSTIIVEVTAFVLTAVALTLSVPASLTTVSQEQEPPWRHIQELARAGQYQDALAEMEHLLSKDPDNPRAWFLSGLLLQRIGQPLQAQGQLERAVSLAPNEPHYRMVCAELQLRNGYRFRARETLAPLLDDAHWGDLAHDQLWFLADLFYRTEQPEAASRALESYARLRPDDPRLPFRRGQIALSSSDLRAAEAAFREALRQGYHAREAAYGLALVLFQSGELEEAAGILNGFLNQAGDDPELAQLYASVLLGLDRPQEALDCLRRVEHLAANFPDLYETTARAYSRLGNREKALEYRQRFTELDRQRREVGEDSEKIHSLLQAGQEFLKQGQAEEARKRFEEVLQIDPDQVMALGYLVGIYSGRKESEKAENLLRRLQATAPEAFETLYLTTLVHYERGELQEALAAGRKAKSIQPGFSELRNLLGNILYALQDFAGAAEEYEAAYRLAPEREEFRANYLAAARRAGLEVTAPEP